MNLQRLIEMSYSGRSKAPGTELAARSQHITIDRLTGSVPSCIIPVRKNKVRIRYAPESIGNIPGQPIPPRAGYDILAIKLFRLQAHDIDDRQRRQSGNDHN